MKLNMHSLNTERAEEIRRVVMVVRLGKGEYKVLDDVTAVSGVMLKRFHLMNMVLLNESLNLETGFCPVCRRGDGIRVLTKQDAETYAENRGISDNRWIDALGGSEADIIEVCAGEDVHGFLRTQPPLRRESLIKFSWLLPVPESSLLEAENVTPTTILQHSRNIREILDKDPKEVKRAQMPYSRPYSSGVYGFVSLVDLYHIGYSFSDMRSIQDNEEIWVRRYLAVKAYEPLLTCQGANMARAIPATEVEEITLVWSSCPLPAPIHPVYEGYIDKNIKLYKSYASDNSVEVRIYVWSEHSEGFEQSKTDNFSLEYVEEPYMVFNEILEYLKEKITARKRC